MRSCKPAIFRHGSQVSRAAKMTRDYQWKARPTFVVAGRYATMAAEPARLLQVVDELIAKAKTALICTRAAFAAVCLMHGAA